MLIRLSRVSTWILSILCLFVFSRGLFELWSSKVVGYGFGLVGLAGIVSVAGLSGVARAGGVRSGPAHLYLILSIYTVAAATSLIVTTFSGGHFLIAVLYTSLHLFFLYSLLFLSSNSGISTRSLWWPLHLTGLVVAVSGMLEFIGFIRFPGDAEFGGHTRLAGSLGSKQHFSFAAASLGMLTFWMYIRYRGALTLVIALSLIFLSFASLSRNGYPIIFGTLALYFFSDVARFLRRHLVALLVSIVVALVLLQMQPQSFREAFEDRLTNLADPSERANKQRIGIWLDGIDAFLDGPILFGMEAGTYSQAATRLGFMETPHYESAIVQQFVNFGIFGGLSFALFFAAYVISIDNRYLRGLAAMVAATYVYYPGSETIPIIAVWFLIAIADSESRRARYNAVVV